MKVIVFDYDSKQLFEADGAAVMRGISRVIARRRQQTIVAVVMGFALVALALWFMPSWWCLVPWIAAFFFFHATVRYRKSIVFLLELSKNMVKMNGNRG